jgi:hypothetical protein
MALDTATILAQIDDLLGHFDEAKRAAQYDDFSGGLPDEELTAIATRLLAGIKRLSGADSEYTRRALALEGHEAYLVQQLGGILHGFRGDVEAGYTSSLVELVHAEVFADFLEMASELQRSGFKDAAAVIAGSTLEEHLRKLAAKAQLPTTGSKGEPLKASRLNDALKGPVYNPLQHRAVQGWLDIRNAAAHGHYGEYEHQQVAALIQGVTDFMSRHPA